MVIKLHTENVLYCDRVNDVYVMKAKFHRTSSMSGRAELKTGGSSNSLTSLSVFSSLGFFCSISSCKLKIHGKSVTKIWQFMNQMFIMLYIHPKKSQQVSRYVGHSLHTANRHLLTRENIDIFLLVHQIPNRWERPEASCFRKPKLRFKDNWRFAIKSKTVFIRFTFTGLNCILNIIVQI